jgi:hypothetical protein
MLRFFFFFLSRPILKESMSQHVFTVKTFKTYKTLNQIFKSLDHKLSTPRFHDQKAQQVFTLFSKKAWYQHVSTVEIFKAYKTLNQIFESLEQQLSTPRSHAQKAQQVFTLFSKRLDITM